MRIGLLLCDTLDPALRDQYVGFEEIFKGFFNSYVDHSLTFKKYEVSRGEFPRSLSDCDCYVISGSRFSVYDKKSWIDQLSNWIRNLCDSDIKLIGICFGHQMIAQALGGQVQKSVLGWTVGLQTYDLVEPLPWVTNGLKRLRLFASHQDKVTQLPQGAVNYSRNERSEFSGFYIGEQILTLQAHPEFEPEILRHIIESRKNLIGPTYRIGLASLLQSTDKVQAGELMRRFIHASSLLRKKNNQRIT